MSVDCILRVNVVKTHTHLIHIVIVIAFSNNLWKYSVLCHHHNSNNRCQRNKQRNIIIMIVYGVGVCVDCGAIHFDGSPFYHFTRRTMCSFALRKLCVKTKYLQYLCGVPYWAQNYIKCLPFKSNCRDTCALFHALWTAWQQRKNGNIEHLCNNNEIKQSIVV